MEHRHTETHRLPTEVGANIRSAAPDSFDPLGKIMAAQTSTVEPGGCTWREEGRGRGRGDNHSSGVSPVDPLCQNNEGHAKLRSN